MASWYDTAREADAHVWHNETQAGRIRRRDNQSSMQRRCAFLISDRCPSSGPVVRLIEAVRRRDTPALFEWLVDTFSYQGTSDRIAWRFTNEHGRLTWAEVDWDLTASPSCPRLRSYWHYHECRFGKLAQTCAEPSHFTGCPVPTHDLRNGRLNQSAYALYLFVRDVCGGDLVGWVDARLSEADRPGDPDRGASMVQAVLDPLAHLHGVSFKVLSMAFAEILLGADPSRERWLAAGAGMIAIDTLVHNWLHRSGCLRRLGAEHAYGPSCYAPGGCAAILEEAARHIDARAFCPDGPAYFPRLVQAAVIRVAPPPP